MPPLLKGLLGRSPGWPAAIVVPGPGQATGRRGGCPYRRSLLNAGLRFERQRRNNIGCKAIAGCLGTNPRPLGVKPTQRQFFLATPASSGRLAW